MSLPNALSTGLAGLFLGALAANLACQGTIDIVAKPGSWTLEVGNTVPAWTYNGSVPGPTLRIREGQTLRVRLKNLLPEPTTLHFHGQPMPAEMDGVPGMTMPAVAPGQDFTYEFVARPAGTYWFHPHVGLQLDRGLYGVLIVDPVGGGDPPSDREHVLVLDDVLAGPPVGGADPSYVAHVIQGRTSLGQTAFPVRVGEKLRLRFLNAGTGTHYVVAVDGHVMQITHVDGQRIVPLSTQALLVGAGERYDVIVDANQPGAWSIAAASIENRAKTLVRAVLRYEGSTQPDPSPSYVPAALATAALPTYAQMRSAVATAPIQPVPDRVHDLQLAGGMMSYVFTINGQSWPNAAPLPVRDGEAVRFRIRNTSMHWHPMHVHGHFFRILGSAGGNSVPLQKDTIMIPPGMTSPTFEAEVRADNPGAWMFHCHNLYHAEAGMMRAVVYENGDRDQDGLDDGDDMSPTGPYPVQFSDPLDHGYAIGKTLSLRVQWLPGELSATYLGSTLLTPISLGVLGELRIQPDLFAGAVVVDAQRIARIDVMAPFDPALRGVVIGVQSIASHKTLPPGMRVSTRATITLQ